MSATLTFFLSRSRAFLITRENFQRSRKNSSFYNVSRVVACENRKYRLERPVMKRWQHGLQSNYESISLTEENTKNEKACGDRISSWNYAISGIPWKFFWGERGKGIPVDMNFFGEGAKKRNNSELQGGWTAMPPGCAINDCSKVISSSP